MHYKPLTTFLPHTLSHTPQEPYHLVKLCTHTPVSHTIDLELKHQSCTLTPHIQGKVQVVKLDTFCCRESSEQALRHSIEVCSQRADINKAFFERFGGRVCVAGNKIVFYDKGLPRAEVACVVEGYRPRF